MQKPKQVWLSIRTAIAVSIRTKQQDCIISVQDIMIVGRQGGYYCWQFSRTVSDPVSLHKYLYAHANPINNSDPTGNFTMFGVVAAI